MIRTDDLMKYISVSSKITRNKILIFYCNYDVHLICSSLLVQRQPPPPCCLHSGLKYLKECIFTQIVGGCHYPPESPLLQIGPQAPCQVSILPGNIEAFRRTKRNSLSILKPETLKLSQNYHRNKNFTSQFFLLGSAVALLKV